MRRSVLAFMVILLVALPATSFAADRSDGVNVAAIAWAPADSAAIAPGNQTFTEGAQCTSNFVFTDGAGAVYIGQSAHCAGTGGATETNGCLAGSLPLGTPVEVDGASRPGTLAYSSWLTMQARNEGDDFTCRFNDFALVKLDPADYAAVNPSIPSWGGPVAVGASTSTLDKIYTYGNSSLRFGVTALSPKEGYSLGQQSGGWNHQVYTVTPGIPGDSGSAVLSANGAALGTLSTVAAAPFPASNGVSDIARELQYAQSFSGIGGLQLALGTEPFVGGLLP
jgi:hypothetical protein